MSVVDIEKAQPAPGGQGAAGGGLLRDPAVCGVADSHLILQQHRVLDAPAQVQLAVVSAAPTVADEVGGERRPGLQVGE